MSYDGSRILHTRTCVIGRTRATSAARQRPAHNVHGRSRPRYLTFGRSARHKRKSKRCAVRYPRVLCSRTCVTRQTCAISAARPRAAHNACGSKSRPIYLAFEHSARPKRKSKRCAVRYPRILCSRTCVIYRSCATSVARRWPAHNVRNGRSSVTYLAFERSARHRHKSKRYAVRWLAYLAHRNMRHTLNVRGIRCTPTVSSQRS